MTKVPGNSTSESDSENPKTEIRLLWQATDETGLERARRELNVKEKKGDSTFVGSTKFNYLLAGMMQPNPTNLTISLMPKLNSHYTYLLTESSSPILLLSTSHHYFIPQGFAILRSQTCALYIVSHDLSQNDTKEFPSITAPAFLTCRTIKVRNMIVSYNQFQQ